MRHAALFVSFVLSATTPNQKPVGDRVDLRAELGGISSILVVVDAPTTAIGGVQVPKEDIRERARKILAESNRPIITQSEALKSMKGVGVVRVVVDIVPVSDSHRLAVNLETEVRRRALVDCCAYYALAGVWKTQDLKVIDKDGAIGELNRMVEAQVRSVVSALRTVSDSPPTGCDSCQLFDGK